MNFEDIDGNHYPFDQISESSDNKADDDERDEIKKKIKSNTKNTYIKKINSLMKITHNDPTNAEFMAQTGNSNDKKNLQKRVQSSSNMNGQKDNDKLAKNRESARNSRKRKKIYLELLEHKVTNLSDNLEVYKQICEKTHELALSFQGRINTKREQDHSKLILFNNMQNAVQSNTSEQNIDTIIESLNKKFGPTSLERMQQIDHYTKQIMENAVSQQNNFLVHIAKNNIELFSNNQNDSEQSQLLKQLKLTDKQKQLLIKKKAKLLKNYQELNNVITTVSDTRSQIINELGNLETTLELLRKELKPSQVARFLLSIEKKNLQDQYRESFERTFGAGQDGYEDDDSLELYQFMNEHNICNSLGIDANQTYEIYKKSSDFLSGRDERKNSIKAEE